MANLFADRWLVSLACMYPYFYNLTGGGGCAANTLRSRSFRYGSLLNSISLYGVHDASIRGTFVHPIRLRKAIQGCIVYCEYVCIWGNVKATIKWFPLISILVTNDHNERLIRTSGDLNSISITFACSSSAQRPFVGITVTFPFAAFPVFSCYDCFENIPVMP